MKKNFSILFFYLGLYLSYSQIGIGTVTPSSSTILDIVSTDKGVLFPRVALQGKNDTITITNGNQQGLLVFNTAAVNDVTPGFYYWNNVEWVQFSTDGSSNIFQVVYYASNGQAQFITPVAFSNPNKLNVYRNGLRIGFTPINPSTIELEPEATCNSNDEIRIVQSN